MGVRWSTRDDRRRWYRFNASVLTREGRRGNEALPKDEAEPLSSSWFNGKET
jgi:hypothetical protein